MPDPSRLLDEFDPHDTALPPSAAQIRHRGDRLRRRNRALAVVGSAVAVAVIATPLALLNRGDDQTAPPPAEPPQGGFLTEVPDAFPLTWEMPRTNADGTAVVVTDRPGVTELSFCGETVWTPQDPAAATDVAGVVAIGPDSSGVSDLGPNADLRARTVAVYAGKAEARNALASIRSGLDGCTDDPSGDRFEADPVEADSVSYTRSGIDEAGEAFEEGVLAQRYGNALFLDLVRGEVLRSGLTDAQLYDALGVFEGKPIPMLEGVKLPGGLSLQSSEVPRPRALPADGVTRDFGPWRAVFADSSPYVACRPDGTLDQLGPSVRFTSQFRAGPDQDAGADLKVALGEFADRDAARQALSTVMGWADGCGYETTSADAGGRYLATLPVESEDGTTRLHALGLAQQGPRLMVVAYSAVDTGTTRDDLVAETGQVLDLGLGR